MYDSCMKKYLSFTDMFACDCPHKYSLLSYPDVASHPNNIYLFMCYRTIRQFRLLYTIIISMFSLHSFNFISSLSLV